MKKIFLGRLMYAVCIMTILLIGCGDNIKSGDIITIDVTKSYPKKEIALQDIADVKYIPLETKDGFYTSGDIFYADNENIILLNYNAGSIVIFDGEGRALNTINHKGRGPQEYIYPYSFFFDRANMEFYVYDLSKICVYDYNGCFKRSLPMTEDEEYEAIGDFNNTTIICYEKGRVSGIVDSGANKPFLLISKQDGSFISDIEIYFENPEYSSLLLSLDNGQFASFSYESYPIREWGESYLLNEISLDTIYTINRSDFSVKPLIARTPKISSMNVNIYLFPMTEIGRYIFMERHEMRYDVENEEYCANTELLYDKIEKRIYEHKVYNRDFTDRRKIYIDQKNESYIALRYNAVSLIQRHEEGILAGELAGIASKLDENDNPVVLLAKLKDE